jgi:hypothetical protein
VLETVARIPYFAFISILHMYESLGFWRAAAELRKIHFAEEWNELHHLQVRGAGAAGGPPAGTLPRTCRCAAQLHRLQERAAGRGRRRRLLGCWADRLAGELRGWRTGAARQQRCGCSRARSWQCWPATLLSSRRTTTT